MFLAADPVTQGCWFANQTKGSLIRINNSGVVSLNVLNVFDPTYTARLSADELTGDCWLAAGTFLGNPALKKVSSSGVVTSISVTSPVFPYAISVNANKNEVWVGDFGGNRYLYKLDKSLNKLCSSTIAIGRNPMVAVNPQTGNCWVSAPADRLLYRFDTNSSCTNSLATAISGSATSNECYLAINPSEIAYKANLVRD